jgi:hypothetical protein
MSQPFEIRNRGGTGMLSALLMLAGAAGFGFLALKGVELGSGRGPVFLAAVVALGVLGLGLSFLRRAFDKRVQVVLEREGFRDRRLGNVMVPWADVRQARYVSVRRYQAIVFKLDRPVPPRIRYSSGIRAVSMALPWMDETMLRMDITGLDWSGADILAAVRELAPHVTVDW